ncbi:rifin PIR protein, putative [Plasmodium reichenowi]|uniref:Rifin PIR protein, putative n=1 Tax=Plasmodium reichenowi TaxID=5854 RepID=A0A2P9D6Q1_PLARE|nr:rifin PIR protein, putative [Plasmodium reichenowi]
MKVHYINALLFALPLNILLLSSQVHNKNKQSITLPTPHTSITRLLCEGDLYMPNYDNDPQMKKIMDNFNKQTQQRLRQHDDRMKEKRKQCREQCDKEIEKILLKDKIEKELAEKFVRLDTNIHTNDIPTCVCEKPVSDKVEKSCLKCGINLGAAVPGLGVLGAYGAHSMIQLAMEAAKELGIQLAIEEGKTVGVKAVIAALNKSLNIDILGGIPLNTVLNGNNFRNIDFLVYILKEKYNTICTVPDADLDKLLCSIGNSNPTLPYKLIESNVPNAVAEATEVATSTTEEMTPIYTTQELSKVTSAGAILSNPIVIAFIVIVILIVTLLIIYLILRYRRKRKTNKKLQYIKLLKE